MQLQAELQALKAADEEHRTAKQADQIETDEQAAAANASIARLEKRIECLQVGPISLQSDGVMCNAGCHHSELYHIQAAGTQPSAPGMRKPPDMRGQCWELESVHPERGLSYRQHVSPSKRHSVHAWGTCYRMHGRDAVAWLAAAACSAHHPAVICHCSTGRT